MIADIEAGLVKRVIIKDMSRFGRDYLQVGMYTEIMFPEHDIHFIAVNDGVDSTQGDNEFTPFRNIINEWYAKDTSKKIRAVMKVKGNAGEHLATLPPYGYMKSPDDKKQWVKDEEAAQVVYEIGLSQLKFLYPLKTLVFPAFSPPRFGPFPSFFPLREEMRETFFRPSLQPYPAALRKFAWPLWWRGRKCSSWYLHQNVPAAPAHPWVLPREREGWSYMYASTDGSENHPYPRSSFGSIGIRC